MIPLGDKESRDREIQFIKDSIRGMQEDQDLARERLAQLQRPETVLLAIGDVYFRPQTGWIDPLGGHSRRFCIEWLGDIARGTRGVRVEFAAWDAHPKTGELVYRINSVWDANQEELAKENRRLRESLNRIYDTLSQAASKSRPIRRAFKKIFGGAS